MDKEEALKIELMKMRSDDGLLIEPHPFSEDDFDMSNPVAYEILKTGIEIKNNPNNPSV